MTLPPHDEDRRLARLRDLLVLDSEPEPVFDTLARMASEACGVPVALLSLIDAERQWFKANVGLPGVNETPRDVAFCDHAIRADEVFEVHDATVDPRFAANPLVTGAPDIRFYAGAPLVLAGGERVGTLCVIDRQQRSLSPAQRQQLQQLARVTVEALEMRRALIDKSLAVRSQHEQALADSERRHRAMLDAQSELVSQAASDGRLLYVNPAYARHFGRSVETILGSNLFDYVEASDREVVRERVAWVLSTGESLTGENRMATGSGDERWFAWTNTLQQDADGRPLLHSVGRDISARKRAEQALRASQAFLERTGRAAGVGGWELDLGSGNLVWSDQTRRLHDVGPEFQPTLDNAITFYPPQVRPRIEQAVQAGMAHGTPWDLELPLVTARGRALWVRTVGEVEFEGGRPARLVGAVQDITERVHAAHELQRQTAILRSVAEATPALVSVVDAALRYRFVNGAFERWHGLDRDQVLGRTAQEVLPVADVERSMPWARRALAGEAVHFERDHPERPGAPHLAVDYIPLRLDDGSTDGFVGIAHDITQHRHEQLRLRALSQSDALTGLLNRAGFEQQLDNLLDDHTGEPLALLYIDLDRFKPVNDTHGHAVGDALLRTFARRLVRLVRPSDAVARLGGDEFAVLLPGMRDAAQAERVARQVVDAALRPFVLPDHPGLPPLQVGASVGGAVGMAVRGGWPALLARADRMLYRAKAEGRGRFAVDAGDQLGA